VADKKHVARLEKGVDAWNAWRSAKGAQKPDLSGANLNDADLSGADLSGANLIQAKLRSANLARADLNAANLKGADLSSATLEGAKLMGADLSGAYLIGATLRIASLNGANLKGADLSSATLDRANLSGANLTEAKLYANLSGANLNDADLSAAKLAGANLNGANLDGANVSGAYLLGAHLSGAYLIGARLSGADLNNAYLNRADLSGANLTEAKLYDADLSAANLSGANLAEAMLSGAYLINSRLSGADLTQATFGETIFSRLDLASVIGLETCRHRGPSTIDHLTLQKSGRLPLPFLRGVGLPDALIDYLPSLLDQPLQFYSCFISYSTRDQEFADRIYADLQNKGVRCWFAPHDMPIGGKIREEIDVAIRLRDKLLLILSEHSIESYWVEDEVEAAYEEESNRRQTVLFPIRLDDAVIDTKEAWAAKLRRARNIGDFRNWKDHNSYKASFDRVMRDLAPKPNDKD
jgi:uncharacterized protein YjbI with pentapeptide repeats